MEEVKTKIEKACRKVMSISDKIFPTSSRLYSIRQEC